MADKLANIRGKGNPWKPGQSGNPKGRPKKDVSLTTLLKKYLNDVPNVLVDKKPNTKTWRELLVQAWLVGAYKGNATLFVQLLERLEGKMALPITGAEGADFIPSTLSLIFPEGTEIKPGRMDGNGHKEVEVEAGGNGHKSK